MNPLSKIAAAVSLAGAAALALAGCSGASAPETAGDGPRIVTTTTQVNDFVANITEGTGATVTPLLDAGASAHSFEAEPADLVAIAEADIVIASGYGLETWLDDTLSAADYDGPTVHAADGFDPATLHDGPGHDAAAGHGDAGDAGTDAGTDAAEGGDGDADHSGHDHADDHEHDHEAAADGADAADAGNDSSGHDHSHDHGDDAGHDHDHGDDGHDHGGVDPHVWTAPMGAAYMVTAIAEGLAEADPANAETYRANAQAYNDQLAALDLWIGENVAGVPESERLLVTNHHALSYFNASYHITLVGSIMPSWDDNAEPSAAELDALIAAIKESGVKAVFSESQLSPAVAETIASEAGVQVYTGDDALSTDALGQPGSATATYIGATVHNATLILDSWGVTASALPEALQNA